MQHPSMQVSEMKACVCHCAALHAFTEEIPYHQLVDKGPRAEGEPEPGGSISLCEVEMDPRPAALWHAVIFPVGVTEAQYKPV